MISCCACAFLAGSEQLRLSADHSVVSFSLVATSECMCSISFGVPRISAMALSVSHVTCFFIIPYIFCYGFHLLGVVTFVPHVFHLVRHLLDVFSYSTWLFRLSAPACYMDFHYHWSESTGSCDTVELKKAKNVEEPQRSFDAYGCRRQTISI